MNKRIEELLFECGAEDYDGSLYPGYVDYEKFAELMIQECAKAVLATPCPYDERHPLFPQLSHTWQMAVLESHRQMLIHFGMKVGERNDQPWERNE